MLLAVQVNYYMPRLLPDYQIYTLAQSSDIAEENAGVYLYTCLGSLSRSHVDSPGFREPSEPG